MKPVKFESDGTPCFSKNDIDNYGMPEYYGYTNYLVIDSYEKEMVFDYDMEHSADLRKIHRYDRTARFKATLLDMVGERGTISDHIICIMKTYLDLSSPKLWDDCRKILKHYRQRKYYNKIPMILQILKFDGYKLKGNQLDEIVNDFKFISEKFDQFKKSHNRMYFPSMRFVALKLLEKYDSKCIYEIPKMRTDRKYRALETLWENLTQ
jgi:hypothetical protein